MPDSSSVNNINRVNFNSATGAPIRGHQINQIGNLLNNISAQNGIRAFVTNSGIKLYGTGGGGSIMHRFKIVRATQEQSSESSESSQSEELTCIRVYKGDWIRNQVRIGLTTDDVGINYITLENDEFTINKKHYIYVELDKTLDPASLQAKVAISLADIEPSGSSNLFRLIGEVTLDKDGNFLAPVQYQFSDINNDVNSIYNTDISDYNDGGTGTNFDIVTNIQYDSGSNKLQKKTRTITVKQGWLQIGAESDWTDWHQAVPCP